MRFRPRIDSTQRAIIEALRKAGATVYSLAMVGAGVPDLLCGARGNTYLLECKSPRSRLKSGKPRTAREVVSAERQQAWRDRWRGGPVHVVETPLEALMACSLSQGGIEVDS